MDMGTVSLFAWLVLVPVVLGSDNIKHVWCTNDDVRNQRNLIKGLKVDDMLCEAAITNDFPWTLNGTKDTPAAPDHMEAEYRTYKTNNGSNSREIAVYVSWTYRRHYFNHVEQFHIELNFLQPFGVHRMFLMKWDGRLTSAVNETSALYLKFHFIYSGKLGNYHIHPNDEYRFKVQPCPVYNEDKNPQSIEKFITIPGCTNKNISRTDTCMKMPCPTGQERRKWRCRRFNSSRKTTISKKNEQNQQAATNANDLSTSGISAEQQGKEAVHIILLMLGGLVIVGFVIMFIWIFKRRKKMCNGMKQPPTKNCRRVLLVCTADSQFADPINQLIAILGKFQNLEVTCNLRLKNEIGQLGIQRWAAKYVCHADAIAFLVANAYEVAYSEGEDTHYSRLDNMEEHQVGIVIKAAEAIYLKNKGSEQKAVVVADLKGHTKNEAAPYFKHLKLPADFKRLIGAVVGEAAGSRVSKKDKNLFQSYLCIAQNKSGRVTVIKEDQSTKMDDDEQSLKIGKGQNDLNFSLFPALDVEEKSCLLNILSDGPPSCESNQSRSCVTTDCNDDTQFERFRQAGAIPKVPS